MDWIALVLAVGGFALAYVVARWLTHNTMRRLVWLNFAWGLTMAAYRQQVTPMVRYSSIAFAVVTAAWATKVWHEKRRGPPTAAGSS